MKINEPELNAYREIKQMSNSFENKEGRFKEILDDEINNIGGNQGFSPISSNELFESNKNYLNTSLYRKMNS